jgi:hypothetical protein
MNTNSGRAGRWMGWRPISVMAFALLLALLFGVQVSHAQSGGDLCLRDAAGFDNPNICRANDVRIIEFSMESSLESCVAGDTIDVTLRVKLRPGASTRYDIGLYIAEDGGNAMDRDAVCYRDYLQPVSDDNLDLNLVDGYGPFFNGEIGASAADFCGDIERRQDAVYVMSPVRITCTDGDGDGYLDDLWTVVSWANNQQSTCNDESDAVPDQTSKCRNEAFPASAIRVEPSTATLEVRKEVDPPTTSGFNLLIDDMAEASNVGDGGSTGPVEMPVSDVGVGDLHTVGERAAPGTSLADYDTRIYCVDIEGDEFSVNDAGPLSVYLQPDDEMVCTITNTFRAPGIAIIKDTNGLPGSFPFTSSLDPTPVELSHGERAVYDEGLESGGVYTFTEDVPEGWQLIGITCIGAGASNVEDGDTSVAITFVQGERIDCTFTDEPLVSLEVTKTADPTSVYEPGGWVDFEVMVESNGPVELTLTSLFDDVYGDVADAANPDLDSTTCSVPRLLPAGDTYTCLFEAEVTGVVGDEQTDTVTVTAADPAGAQLTGQDDATVLILGEPPYTGVGLGPSVVVGGLVAIGVALLGLGLLMRRRMLRTR